MVAEDKIADLPPFHTDEDATDFGVEHRNADLVGFLMAVGPTVAAGMGQGPLTHTCLRDWMANTCHALSPWDCEALVIMSRAYAGAHCRLGCQRRSH